MDQDRTRQDPEISPWQVLVFAACVCFSLVLLGPLGIFANNSEDFSSALEDLLLRLSVVAGILFCVLFLTLTLSPRKIKNASVRGLALLVLYSWIMSNFLYGDYGQLDGQALTIPIWGWLAFGQSVVLLLLLYLSVRVPIKVALNTASLVFFMGLISVSVAMATLEESRYQSTETGFHPELTEFSSDKNVLHVVLDALQSDLLYRAIESDDQLKSKFDGFTFFRDALSVYPSTEMSVALLMTGQTYHNEMPKDEFLESLRARETGVRRLKKIGYELDAHTKCNRAVVSRCTPLGIPALGENAYGTESLQVLDIHLFKSVPDYIKPLVYNQERWLLLDWSPRNDYLKSQTGVAHLLFAKFVEEISVSDSIGPRYKFFHSLVTHTPLVLSVGCQIVNKGRGADPGRIDFVRCGLDHFSKLLEKLNALGIYDNTMIILSSDHGADWVDDSLDIAMFEERGINRKILGRAIATLAVKPFNARGGIAMTLAPVSLRDIPQTILAENGIDHGVTDTSEPGRDVFTVAVNEDRTREYLYYEWKHKFWEALTLPPINSFRVNGKVRDPSAWPRLRAIDPVRISCGKAILFNQTLTGLTALSGLSGIEKWGRWSDGKEVSLSFSGPETPCKKGSLRMDLMAHLTKDHRVQKVSVFLNNSRLGSLHFEHGKKNRREIDFTIPDGLIRTTESNILSFEIENPLPLYTRNDGKRGRQLGIGIYSIVYE